ncbi:histone-lysine N-methyltransferase H3 lysine-9 specific SUVH3-like [Prunus yedoensis var. nudiflora]|uniref:Histone-lysine N-methyltransferase H3 lysine-9 specific SUVH3-like n=1 Tax=Prunus yedoensis var. nudiflora TaxID=2094558 RepID=A0A314ZDJ1_PRUYE|nr:histone-lysine N-methyltransferase H3 lysine-9 specific SUVH3-like [Prunus yedoensis var. nudiflora]
MEGGSSHNFVPPSAGFDKSCVLDVKPLRSLMPVFPDASQAPPFACMPPFGRTPNGYSSFYPFHVPKGSQTSPNLNSENPSPMRTTGLMPAPIRSYRAPAPSGALGERGSSMGGAEEEDGYFDARPGSSSSRKKTLKVSSSRKKNKKSRDGDSLTNNGSGVNFVSVMTPFQLEDGNRELVNYVLMNFDALRRRICQIEDAKESKMCLHI